MMHTQYSTHHEIILFQDLLKKLKFGKSIKEGNLVLDQDLIDLTMIPPPMTPDEVRFPFTGILTMSSTIFILCTQLYL